jgi:hypothetical protein
MKTHGIGGIIAPFSISALDEGVWSASRSCRFISGEINPGIIVQEAEWAPDPVWTIWKTENRLPLPVESNPDSSMVQPVA